MAENVVLELTDVTFGYDGPVILEDVNFALRDRDFVSIVGPNGGGKTTLLRLILGLIRPSRGTISVFGKSPEDVRHRIGYMPQDAQLDPKFPVTVMDVVLMGQLTAGKRLGFYSKAQKEAAVEALLDVDLLDLRKEPLSRLSGGQKRRVLIARALAGNPDLLLLDEPTANLDHLVEQELHSVLRRLNERLTVVMVSHDLAFVSKHVDNVICVNRKVAMHATGEIDGELFNKMFGGDIRMVMHDRHFRNGEQG